MHTHSTSSMRHNCLKERERGKKSSAIQYLHNNSSLKRFFIQNRHAFTNHTLLTRLQIAHFQSLSGEMIKNLCLLIGYNRLIKFFEWSAKTRHDVLDIVSYRRHDTIFLLESSANWMWWDVIYRLLKKQFQALSQEMCFPMTDSYVCQTPSVKFLDVERKVKCG